jgi:hypothetical protein
MELVQLRRAVAQDLHGAFAEWEARAAALTHIGAYLELLRNLYSRPCFNIF